MNGISIAHRSEGDARLGSGDTPLSEPASLRLVQASGPQLKSDFPYSTVCHFEDPQRCAAQRHPVSRVQTAIAVAS
jgi:hypothetical protein